MLQVGAAAPRGDAVGTKPGDRAVLAGWEHLTEVSPESWDGQGTGLGSDSSRITPSRGPRGSPKESNASHSAPRWSQEQSYPPVITLQPCLCPLRTPKADNEGVFHPRGSSSPNRWEMVQAGHVKARPKRKARLVTNTITPGCQRRSSNGLHPAGEMGRVLGRTSITSPASCGLAAPTQASPSLPFRRARHSSLCHLHVSHQKSFSLSGN